MLDLHDWELKCMKPFDLRRERRALYRYCKKHRGHSKAVLRRVLQSERKYNAWITEGYDEAFAP